MLQKVLSKLNFFIDERLKRFGATLYQLKKLSFLAPRLVPLDLMCAFALFATTFLFSFCICGRNIFSSVVQLWRPLTPQLMIASVLFSQKKLGRL